MTGWRLAESPQVPPEGWSPGLVTVDDAMLTRFSVGRLRTTERTDQWLRGAVHDASGHLVPESQRMRGDRAGRVVSADPRSIATFGDPTERLEGTWLYAGHWMHVFGHFVLETLTNLWPSRPADLAGLVCHRWYRTDPRVETWQQDLLDRAGYAGLPVRIAGVAPVRVDRLVVPERPVVIGGWAAPEAVDVWRRVSGGAAAGPDRVFLSRTAFNRAGASRSTPERDADLDRDFADAGFEVVAPETLSITDQIRLVTRARVIAGAAGSGLHLSAFAARPSYVIEVGDTRSPGRRLTNQRVIDAACGHHEAFVHAHNPARDLLAQLDWTVADTDGPRGVAE